MFHLSHEEIRQHKLWNENNREFRRNKINGLRNPMCLFLRLHNECSKLAYPFEEKSFVAKVIVV
jgi:hypothetical protein